MTGINNALIRNFLKQFAQEIVALRKSGHFSDDWLLDGRYNHYGRLHGRLWAAMVRAVSENLVPNLEVRLQKGKRKFKPDLLICGRKDVPKLMVELESTNSSDWRVITRDIPRIKYLAQADGYPSSALIITVLPSEHVKYLPMHGDLTREEKAKRRKNPYEFYRDKFLRSFKNLIKAQSTISVVWANLDLDGIRLEFWDRVYERKPFWSIQIT